MYYVCFNILIFFTSAPHRSMPAALRLTVCRFSSCTHPLWTWAEFDKPKLKTPEEVCNISVLTVLTKFQIGGTAAVMFVGFLHRLLHWTAHNLNNHIKTKTYTYLQFHFTVLDFSLFCWQWPASMCWEKGFFPMTKCTARICVNRALWIGLLERNVTARLKR